jgi:hypothetical protein
LRTTVESRGVHNVKFYLSNVVSDTIFVKIWFSVERMMGWASQQIWGLKAWMNAPKQAEFFKSVKLDVLEAAGPQADSK